MLNITVLFTKQQVNVLNVTVLLMSLNFKGYFVFEMKFHCVVKVNLKIPGLSNPFTSASWAAKIYTHELLCSERVFFLLNLKWKV